MSKQDLSDNNVHLKSTHLRVLHVIGSLAARDGGPARAVLTIADEQRRSGIPSAVLTTDACGPRDRQPVSTVAYVEVDGTPVWYCPRSHPYSLQNSWRLLLRLIRIARKTDVLHMHGVYLAHTIYIWILFKLTGKPYIIHPHGTLEPYQQAKNSGRKMIFNGIIGSRILRDAAMIIAASQQEATNITTQYPRTSVQIIPFGLTLAGSIQSESEIFPIEWIEAPSEKRVIFIGRLAKKKRPDLLLEAWGLVTDPDSQLLIVGPDGEWSAEQLLSLSRHLGLTRIHIQGPLARNLVPFALSLAQIFVLPSENESFGLSIVEAMASSCAVVTTLQTAAAEYVEASRSGHVLDSPDQQQLANAISDLLAKPQVTAGMGRAGKDHVVRELSWQRTITNLNDVYSQVSHSSRTLEEQMLGSKTTHTEVKRP